MESEILKTERQIEDYILFLQGIFPLDEEQLSLDCVQTESGISADIYIFSGEQGYWLVLLDATLKEKQLVILQQELNELRLFRDKQAKMFEQSVNLENDKRWAHLALRKGGELKFLSVLFADIRGFTSNTGKLSPDEIFDLLNSYMTPMIRSLLDDGGIIDKIIGDAVMGVFGILPSGISPSVQAVKASFQMIKSVQELKKERQARGETAFDIGIGIASGDMYMGVIGSQNLRKSLNAIGFPVNMASYLEKQARPCEILIDEKTFREINRFQSCFSEIKHHKKTDSGIDKSLKVFSCGVGND